MFRSLARRVAFLAALALFLVAAPRARAEDTVLRDAWSVIEIGGANVGWEHIVVKRLAGSPARISWSTESRMVIRAMGQERESTTKQTTVEAEDGTLLSLDVVEKQSAEETTTAIAFEGTKARITTTAMGQKREAVADVAVGTVGPWRADSIPREAGYPTGKTFDVRTFLREMGGSKVVHIAVAGPEEVEVAKGKQQTLTRLNQTIEGLPFQIAVWVEEDGTPAKVHMTLPGMEVHARRVTQEEALGGGGTKELPPDLFEKTLILSKVLVPHARTAESARIRIRPRRAGMTLPPLADERQTVESREENGTIVLAVRRLVPSEGATGTRPLKDPPVELAPYLAASSAIQSDDALLQEKAHEAVGEETDAWKAAQAIERWVAKNLTKKNMGVGFASALEVCRNREGDCTEHSVLVAGLCRAAGIPARVVMGLEYLQGIWGGHAWNEVWVAGGWYALDATLGYGYADPLHLAVARSALAEGTFNEELLATASMVGAVDVEVLELTWNGRTFRPSDPEAVRVEGTRYENRLFDLSFTAPPGFVVETVEPKGLETRLATATGNAPDGKTVKFVIYANDAPAGFHVPASAEGADAPKVDGRPAALKHTEDRRRAIVVGDDTLYIFEMTPVTGEAAEQAFRDLLSSVDLDPAPASPEK